MSEAAAGMPWSSEQLSWLQALGHVVYLDRDSVVEAPAPVRSMEIDTPAARQAPVERAAPPRRQAPTAPETQAPDTTPEPVASAPRRGRAGLPDRLQIALLRASGLNPNDAATQTLMATWPLAELRANPRAKRALWPQLRALRKQNKARP